MTNIVMLIGPDLYHRYRLIRQALESLLAHTVPGTYNLTLVLDTCGFRELAITNSVIRDLPGDLATSLQVRNSGHTLSQLKNLGVAWSEQRFGRGGPGDWLYISDSDVWFSEGWLEKLISTAEFIEPFKFKLWGGQVHPFHQPIGDPVGGNPWNGSWMDESHPKHKLVSWQEHSILDGPSWLMRWTTWDQHGPFDRTTAPGVCQSEEYPFCGRLTAGGGRIGVISPHVVVHTGLTHLNGHDCVGRAEREAMIPKGVMAE